jgi:hypothetical protein
METCGSQGVLQVPSQRIFAGTIWVEVTLPAHVAETARIVYERRPLVAATRVCGRGGPGFEVSMISHYE